VIESLNRLTRERLLLARALGREPTAPELADRMKLPLGKVQLLLEAVREPASLDAPVGELEDTALSELVSDATAHSPEDVVLRHDLATQVERAMASLADREREVLRLRYGLGTDREHTLGRSAGAWRSPANVSGRSRPARSQKSAPGADRPPDKRSPSRKRGPAPFRKGAWPLFAVRDWGSLRGSHP
jgi:hypothetical protein